MLSCHLHVRGVAVCNNYTGMAQTVPLRSNIISRCGAICKLLIGPKSGCHPSADAAICGQAIHELIKRENAAGSITRQEAVSMIPPLMLDVQGHHMVSQLQDLHVDFWNQDVNTRLLDSGPLSGEQASGVACGVTCRA